MYILGRDMNSAYLCSSCTACMHVRTQSWPAQCSLSWLYLETVSESSHSADDTAFVIQALNLNQLNVPILIQRQVEHQQLFYVDVSAYCACCVHRGALTAVYLSSASYILEKFFNPNSVNPTACHTLQRLKLKTKTIQASFVIVVLILSAIYLYKNVKSAALSSDSNRF